MTLGRGPRENVAHRLEAGDRLSKLTSSLRVHESILEHPITRSEYLRSGTQANAGCNRWSQGLHLRLGKKDLAFRGIEFHHVRVGIADKRTPHVRNEGANRL